MSHQHNFESGVSLGSFHFGKHFQNLKLKTKQTEGITKGELLTISFCISERLPALKRVFRLRLTLKAWLNWEAYVSKAKFVPAKQKWF